MTSRPWSRWAAGELADITAAGRLRTVRDFDARGPSDGTLVSFASNDYLGLSAHPAVATAAHAAIDRWGTGATAARLIVGGRPVHRELEEELAGWKGTEAGTLFSTGFAANLGVLSVVAGPGTLVCSDELNHASIIDGCRMSRADLAVYPHGDVAALAALLKGRPAGQRAVVVTDWTFSMDGDDAPVAEIASVCASEGALLVVDEAHSVLAPAVDFGDAEVLRVGTLSKTLGSLGGFVAGAKALCDLLVNRARPFIFTTASTPADTAAALAAVRLLRSAEGDALVARLRSVVDRVAPGHPSPIVPLMLGSEEAALGAAAALLARGLLVPAIRPPTVAPGSCRLRIALSAAHSDEQVTALLAGLADLGLDR